MKLCGFDIGLDQPFFLIAGPCVIESRQMAFDTAGQLVEITAGTVALSQRDQRRVFNFSMRVMLTRGATAAPAAGGKV